MIESTSLEQLASLPVPLSSVPEGEVLTAEQWTTFLAILSIYIPSIKIGGQSSSEAFSIAESDTVEAQFKPYLPDDAPSNLLKCYLQESATSSPEFKEAVCRKFKQFVPDQGIQGLAFVLSALNTRAGSLLLTGSTTPIHQQDLATRTTIVSGWAQSYLAPLRALHRSTAGLVKQTWLTQSPTLSKMLDFPAIPKHIKRNPSFDFKFHDFSDPQSSTSLTTDVIIVGSGCGAGVMASHLARAGMKVLVLEKSYHFPSTHFPMNQADAVENLMESGGAILSNDQSIGVVAGSTWGGGGTVNWSASLQPQHFVREEWAREGLPFFTSTEFQDCLDTVCSRMGVAKLNDPAALSKIEHNFANRTLLEGARRLGYTAETVPQNTGTRSHYCGYCSSGCASATKQGPANCWFPDAAAHGAEFIEGCFVDRITFSDSDPTLATGVSATWTSRSRSLNRTLQITAPRAIVASGTLHSPLLLTRSGLKNHHIGRNLHLHPVVALWATWPHRINPWEGPILSSAVTSLENHDGQQHGPKLETLCFTPASANVLLPWHATLNTPAHPAAAALDFKLTLARHAFSTGFISLQRDRDTGSVYADPSNPRLPRIAYTPSQRDLKGLLAGQLLAARIAYVQGAVAIDNMSSGPGGRFERSPTAAADVNHAAFAAWLADAEKAGLAVPDKWVLGSAHQMGTCRMGASADRGVVDGCGRVWGVRNVWVADASVFPSASGVNPMVTVMGIAEGVARGVVAGWKAEREG